jgi:multidrug efflux pump subunit AcrA (membrane-fusion protein)
MVHAAAPGGAEVRAVYVAEGQRVAKDDPLFLLDERDFMPRVSQLESLISQEKNRHHINFKLLKQEKLLLEIAEKSEARAETLLGRELGSQSALDDARHNTQSQRLAIIHRQLEIDNHEARLKDLEAQLLEARTLLERSRLVAPFDAVIVEVNATEGDQVRTGDVILSFYRPDDLEVRAKIPANYQKRLLEALANRDPIIAIGDDGMILGLDRMSGQASSDGIDGLFRINRSNGTVLVGQQVTLLLSLPPQSDLIGIPATALYGNGRIFVLENGVLRAIEVERVGQKMQDGKLRILVRSGELTERARIVITHLPHAVSGLRAQVRKSAPVGPADAGS